MEKSGGNLKEVLNNPPRPTLATLPLKMIEAMEAKKKRRKEKLKEKKLQEKREQRDRQRASRPKRVKIELTRSLLREENDPPPNWLCPRAITEKTTRDKLKSVRLVLSIF